MTIQLPDLSLSIYGSLQRSAAILPLPARTQIEITGADRTNFLHSFCTGDIKKLRPGHGCEAFITNHQGKAIGHVLVFCEEDRLVLDGAPGQSEAIIKHLDRFLISERVEFHDRTAEWTDELVAGTQVESILQKLNVELPAQRLQQTQVVVSIDHLLKAPEIKDCNLHLRRVDFLGEIAAFQLNYRSRRSEAPEMALRIHGTTLGDDADSEAAFHIARIEAGYPLYGIDITEDNLPQEANRTEQAISFTKGCYLGQETIARLDALGHVNRVLTGLKFPEGANPQPGETIMQGEKKIAQLTSVAYSPKLQAPLALAYVRSIHATPGKRIPFADGEVEVVKLPL